MQNQDNIHIKTNPMEQENNLTTPPQGPCLKIGHVSFSLEKSNRNKRKLIPVDYLTKFYPAQYLQRKVQEVIKNLPKDQDKEKNTDLMRAHPEEHFILEHVFDYHFQFVSSTSQEKFILKDSDFRIQYRCKEPAFRELNLWQISFLNLKTLNISESRILSIQSLTFCDLPLIEHLQLEHNYITSLSALSKCSFKYLTSIKCFNNPLITMDKFNRSLLSNLTKLQINNNTVDDFFGRTFQHKRQIGPLQQLQFLQFILKTEGNHKLKEFRLEFGNKLQPIWYQEQLKNLNNSLQIFAEQQFVQRRLWDGPREFERRNLMHMQQQLQLPNQELIIQQIPLRTRRQMIDIRNRRMNHRHMANDRNRNRMLMRMGIQNLNVDQQHQLQLPHIDQFLFPNR